MPGDASDDRFLDWSALVSGLAHELKNPLSTMKINLQLLHEDWSAEEGSLGTRSVQKIEVLLQEARRLERMLSDFMRLTSAAALELRPCDISGLLEDVITFIGPEMRNRNVTLTSQLDRSLPRLDLDENLLRQAILNLLKNAMDATQGHGATITIQTHAVGGEAHVDFIDTGRGMTDETRRRAFSVFYSTRAEGTGLGLPMARQIVARHGGRLICESAAGLGTKMTIVLPLPGSERGGDGDG